MSSKTVLKELGDVFGQDEIVHRSTVCLLTSGEKKKKIINEDGEEEEADDDDESILDPLADSRSTTPALPPQIAYMPAAELEKLSAEEIAARLCVIEHSREAKPDADWKAELVSIVEEDSKEDEVCGDLKNLEIK